MAATKCTHCGKEYNGGENWQNCPDCEEVVCPDCVQNIIKGKQAAEKKQRQQLENVKSLEDYKQISCPHCGTEMNMF